MTRALISEIELQKGFLTEIPKTLYFGGGTPSILNTPQLEAIIGKAREVFDTSMVKEITLEANPEDVDQAKVKSWQDLGINRISLGIQTFNEKQLNSLNRVHTGNQAIKAIEILQTAGMNNITVDLIYGLPAQQLPAWLKNIKTLIEYEIPHISAYALTIENKTVFGHQQAKGLLKVPPDEIYEEQYLKLCDSLKQAGYEHYEVSNFAHKGFRSRHNQLYWQGAPYLGIGPGAHSFDGRNRFFNRSNNADYIRSIKAGKIPCEAEVLSPEEQYNEYLLTRLRTREGINLSVIEKKFKRNLRKEFHDFFERCIDRNLAYLKKDDFALTEAGFFVSDAIILELMK